jgi:DNA polymerase alpha-associated DNA helicase A
MEATLRNVARLMLTQVAVPAALEEVESRRQPFNVDLLKVLFGLQAPSAASLESLAKEPVDDVAETSPIEWFDTTLNDSQKRAVKFTLRANEVACIHGPPGVSFVPQCKPGPVPYHF